MKTETDTGFVVPGGQSASSTIANILKEEVPPIAIYNPVTPPELERILQKCLRKRKEERYASARDLALDLEVLRRGLESAARPNSAIVPFAPAPPLSLPRWAVRSLFALIQLGYLGMYSLVLYKFGDVLRVSLELYDSMTLGGALIVDAVLGATLRLYRLTAVALDYPDVGRKFRWLFPAVLLLDLAWSGTPLLFAARSCFAVRGRVGIPSFLPTHAPLCRIRA